MAKSHRFYYAIAVSIVLVIFTVHDVVQERFTVAVGASPPPAVKDTATSTTTSTTSTIKIQEEEELNDNDGVQRSMMLQQQQKQQQQQQQQQQLSNTADNKIPTADEASPSKDTVDPINTDGVAPSVVNDNPLPEKAIDAEAEAVTVTKQAAPKPTKIETETSVIDNVVQTAATASTKADKINISSCLLVKDDNNRLPEWLAYHYQVLPLRLLVVAMDVDSITSPRAILERWNTTTDMEIQLWNVADLLPATVANMSTHVTKRQEYFLSSCLQYMKKRSSTWVTSHDVDEVIAFNRFTESDPDWETRNDDDNLKADDSIAARNRIPPQTGGNVTIADFIQGEQNEMPWKYQPCVPITRLLFGAVANTNTKLDTMRFLQHRQKGSCSRNCKGKTLIDVTRIPDEHLIHPHYANQKTTTTSEFSPHAPVLECNRTYIPSYRHSVLRVHHYLGSEEAFMAKHDPRRSKRKFNAFKNLKSIVPEMEATTWYDGFVESVKGEVKAKALLAGAGEVDPRLAAHFKAIENEIKAAATSKTEVTTGTKPPAASNEKEVPVPNETKPPAPPKASPAIPAAAPKISTAGSDDVDTYFFHCDDPRSNCTYFSPHQFFETKDGGGYLYRELAHRQNYGMPNRTLDANYCRAKLKKGKLPPRPNFPTDLAYIHVHKAGGITLRYTFDMFPASYRIGSNYTMDRVFTVKAWELGATKMEANLKEMAASTTLFSFVRDPIDRFVSASSEVAVQGALANHDGNKVCYGSDHGAGYMQCFLNKLVKGEHVDQHLVPQSIELYQFSARNKETKIALFTMKSIGDVQRNMGIEPFAGNKKKGLKARYTADKLTPAMIKQICHCYKMDVAMARGVGIPVPRCP